MVRKDVDEELSPARRVESKSDGGEEGSRLGVVSCRASEAYKASKVFKADWGVAKTFYGELEMLLTQIYALELCFSMFLLHYSTPNFDGKEPRGYLFWSLCKECIMPAADPSLKWYLPIFA